MIVGCTEVVSGIWMKAVEVGGGVDWNKVATIMIPPPNYTPFEGLFPLNLYPSLASMPTSQMVHTLVHSLAWTSTLLRGYVSQYPLPSFLGPVDELGRSLIRNTPMWPGSDHTLSSSLEELLAAMLPRYSELIARHSVNY